MGFADSIRANVAKRLEQMDKGVEERADELFRAAVELSPSRPSASYSKGEFINNWMLGLDGIVNGTRGSFNDSGIESLNDIARLRGSKTFYMKDGKVTLSNNTSYGQRVEYAGWPAPEWTGTVGPYAPVAKAFILVVPKFKRG